MTTDRIEERFDRERIDRLTSDARAVNAARGWDYSEGQDVAPLFEPLSPWRRWLRAFWDALTMRGVP